MLIRENPSKAAQTKDSSISKAKEESSFIGVKDQGLLKINLVTFR
jgi:hypothetical protein